MDWSTDAGNVEDELVLIHHCVQDAAVEEMRSCSRYLSLGVPKKANADGLIECLGNSLQLLGVHTILDRTSALGVQYCRRWGDRWYLC